jgi:hypothetical protein
MTQIFHNPATSGIPGHDTVRTVAMLRSTFANSELQKSESHSQSPAIGRFPFFLFPLPLLPIRHSQPE